MAQRAENVINQTSVRRATLMLPVFVCLACSGVYAQGGCLDSGDAGTTTPVLTIHKPDNTCEVTNGMYVKHWASYRVDLQATATGYCNVYTTPPACPLYETQMRWLGASSIYDLWPTGSTYTEGIIQPTGNTQSYNTVGPVNTQETGTNWMPYYVGKYTIYDTTDVQPTICNFTPASYDAIPIHLNSLECKPEFNSPQTYPNLISRLAPANITIYLPPSLSWLSTPLTNALNDWKAQTNATGVVLPVAVTDQDCGTGPACVRIDKTDLGNDAFGNPICAQGGGNYDTSTGYFSSAITITVGNSSSTASTARLQRTFAHELGHLFGLGHNLCAGPDSVMPTGVYACDSTSTTVPDTTTTNDSLPMNSTSYGGGPRTACGF
jgi:hypothetical protein